MAFFTNLSKMVYCVTCKRCGKPVPAGIRVVPKSYVKVRCILCGEVRLYLPTEVDYAFPDPDVSKAEVRKWV